MKKYAQGMYFEAYAEKIMNLREYQQESKKRKKMIQRRLQVESIEMKIISIKKSQFAGLNDKRYYFSDQTTSFPYEHPLLEPLRQKKRKNLKKSENVFRK